MSDDFDPFAHGWMPEEFGSSDDDSSLDYTLSLHVEEKLLVSSDTIPLVSSDGSEGEDSDDIIEDFVKAEYLRFRDAYDGSKQQRKQLTFDKYLDLVQVSQSSSLLPSERRLLPVLTKEHVTAFRSINIPMTLSHESPRSLTTVPVEPRLHDVSDVPTIGVHSPEESETLETVTVETPDLFQPHASVFEASVPSPHPLSTEVSEFSESVTVETLSLQPPHASVPEFSAPSIVSPPPQARSRHWHRRHRAALRAQAL